MTAAPMSAEERIAALEAERDAAYARGLEDAAGEAQSWDPAVAAAIRALAQKGE